MKQKISRFALCSVILASLATPSYVDSQTKSSAPKTPPKDVNYDETIYNWVRTLAEVLELSKEKHYKITDPQTCMVKAIDEFLNHLDPHSSFLDPKTYELMMQATSGEFFGIGIVIDNTRQPKDKFLTAVDIIPDGPADKAGLLPLDKIVEIDGKSLEGITTEEATAKLKGERNTKVHVKVLREGKTEIFSYEITRDVIKEQSSSCFYLPEHNVYYVSLSTFTENAVRQIKELLQQSTKKSYKGLILDLRNNSGGLLNAAVDIAGLFLDKGSLVVTTKDKTGKETERYVTKHEPIVNNAPPIFILINNYTASAGEILAGCLKIHADDASKNTKNKQQKKPMVFLVGTKSFGKGSVQEVIPVSNDSAIKITTALYFLPNDISIQGIGIEPDFVVDRQFPAPEQVAWFNKFYGQESALPNYIKVHEKPEEPKKESAEDDKKKSWGERARKHLNTDNQFRTTITLINLFDSAKNSCPGVVTNRESALKFMKGIFVTDNTIAMEEVKI